MIYLMEMDSIGKPPCSPMTPNIFFGDTCTTRMIPSFDPVAIVS